MDNEGPFQAYGRSWNDLHRAVQECILTDGAFMSKIVQIAEVSAFYLLVFRLLTLQVALIRVTELSLLDRFPSRSSYITLRPVHSTSHVSSYSVRR